MSQGPRIETSERHPGILIARGNWTLAHAGEMLALIEKAPESAEDIDGRDIGRLDSAGAMMLSRYAVKVGLGLATVDVKPMHQPLTETVRLICENPPRVKQKDYGVQQMLARMGYAVEDYTREVLALVGFLGLTLKTALGVILRPARFRLTPTVHHMEQVGLDAVPLVLLLSFMVGAVIAFLGATVLRDFGAEIFVVELVGIAFLREFGVLLTAILLAGRTASAFTAQIGAMQSGEEIDAIRTLGLDPIELLVLPRLTALLLISLSWSVPNQIGATVFVLMFAMRLISKIIRKIWGDTSPSISRKGDRCSNKQWKTWSPLLLIHQRTQPTQLM